MTGGPKQMPFKKTATEHGSGMRGGTPIRCTLISAIATAEESASAKKIFIRWSYTTQEFYIEKALTKSLSSHPTKTPSPVRCRRRQILM
jgi:hypothetical protein